MDMRSSYPLDFCTQRITAKEIRQPLTDTDRQRLLPELPSLLSAAVVEHLPDYFHGIDNPEKAEQWLQCSLNEGHVLLLQQQQSVLGLMLITRPDDNNVHIGYLLAQAYWGQGLASELLQGFIAMAQQNTPWQQLFAGVAKDNLASSHVLKKVGFVPHQFNQDSATYRYSLSSK